MSSPVLKLFQIIMILYMALGGNTFAREVKYNSKVAGNNTKSNIKSTATPSSKVMKHRVASLKNQSNNIHNLRVDVNSSKYPVYAMTMKPTLKMKPALKTKPALKMKPVLKMETTVKVKPIRKYKILQSIIVKSFTFKNNSTNQTLGKTNGVSASTENSRIGQVKRMSLFPSRLFRRLSHNLQGAGSKNASSKPDNGLGVHLIRVYPPIMHGFHRFFVRRRPFANYTDKNDTLLKIVLISNETPAVNNFFQPFLDFFRRMTMSIKSFLHAVK
ncbi:uncharacterized protein LOC118762507 [Octopus sinensis]|uniref:Uncharacterized protein LOC118762507 n=1 Tax=Octopus sinensis TaxID=2607531 RepID=A0A7E6ENW2_9MOLL|nr:uncharacterized protein LOC118762507 [Octopus sinensis]